MAPPAARAADSPLTWGNCLRQARERHPDVRAAAESARAAREAVGSSRATYLPDVNGSVDYSRPHSSSSGDNYSYGISGSQRLFPGLLDQPEVAKAKLGLESAEANLAAVMTTVRLQIRTAFVGLLNAQAVVTLAEKIADRRRRNVALVQARFDAGRENQGSFLRAKAQAAEAELNVRQARRAIRVAQQELLRAIGRADFEAVRADGDFETDTPPASIDAGEWIEKIPPVRKAAADRQAAELGLTIQRREFFPTVSLSGNTSRSDGHWPPRSTSGGWTSALSLSVPLFSGGKELHDVESARAGMARLEFVERSTRDLAVFDVQDKWAGWTDAVEGVDVRREFLDAARLRAEIAQAQYTSGLISYQDWDTIENDLISQERQMLTARRDAALAEAAWDESTGRGIEP